MKKNKKKKIIIVKVEEFRVSEDWSVIKLKNKKDFFRNIIGECFKLGKTYYAFDPTIKCLFCYTENGK